MAENIALLVKLPELSLRDANVQIQQLRDFILNEADESQTKDAIIRVDSQTQDVGSVLILILGTKAIASVLIGVRKFIEKLGSKIIIETSDGRVVARGDAANNIDVAKTVAALKKQ
jgi:hypothetical protein